ncbi:MAG: 4Fe-4S binding protein [Bryobacteraceae bacterium]|nr:4Fe-4S binding protein [Bryobacteraceae bacterium]
MAYQINERCTACGDCLPLCPAHAIIAALPVYRIDPLACIECVGFTDESQCTEACPEQAVEPAGGWPERSAAARLQQPPVACQ